MPIKRKARGGHGGRAREVITQKEWASIDYMCMIHCTGEEIAGVLGIDYDTLNRNCQDKMGMAISEYIKQHSAGGKMSLRRAQWQAAENGNVTMQIWLGKNWLGQKDSQDILITSADDSVREMDEYFAQKKNEARRNDNQRTGV